MNITQYYQLKGIATLDIPIIGIDWATKNNKVGIALGHFNIEGKTIKIENARICTFFNPIELVESWIKQNSTYALIAIDAPLGWPLSLSKHLITHKAGQKVDATADSMFRRDTDIFIQEKTGKKSLDVGADRIARTAHSAVTFLSDLRVKTGMSIPMAWDKNLLELSVIEVYPAVTLLAYGIQAEGYKKPNDIEARKDIVEKMSSLICFPESAKSAMTENADVLDAVVCVLAGADFLQDSVMRPESVDQKRNSATEGWIWSRKRLDTSE